MRFSAAPHASSIVPRHRSLEETSDSVMIMNTYASTGIILVLPRLYE